MFAGLINAINGYRVETRPLGPVESSEDRSGEHVAVVVRSTRIAGVPRRAGPKTRRLRLLSLEGNRDVSGCFRVSQKATTRGCRPKCYSATIDYIWIIYKLR